MVVNKGYKVRLYPNQTQEAKLLQTLGATRFVYNYFLAARKGYYEEYGKTLSFVQMSRDLTQLRYCLWWLAEVQYEPVQQSLRRMDRACMRFFKSKKGFPKFRSKKNNRQSFQKHAEWRVRGNKIQVQGDLLVKYRGTIDPEAELGTLTVSYCAGKWYASMTAKVSVKPAKRHIKPIGIDVGLTTLVTTSKGVQFANIQPQKSNQKSLARAQRVLARRQKGSNRRAEARLALARAYERIANIRRNHLHQVSSAITGKNHALIAVEDLNVRGMVKNRSIARAISDAGWSELIRQIEYKQAWRGGEVIKIDRFFPSSKLCSACGFLAEIMPLSVRKWKCGGCGKSHDRDINAAQNILKEALAQRARGANVRPSRQLAMKRGQR